MLVHRGTLRVGDAIVAGDASGKVRALYDYKGEKVKEARPGEPVEILGFDRPPPAGELARVVEHERQAKDLAQKRAERLRREQLAQRSKRGVSLESLFSQLQEGVVQDLNIVLKGDVQGSVEALLGELGKIQHSEVRVNVIHTGVGGITENDVNLASASNALVIGFNVRPSAEARALAEREGVDIRTYRVIYQLTDEIQQALVGMLSPVQTEETLGEAEVRALFKVSRLGTIAGCMVTSGVIRRNAQVRVVRDGTEIYDTSIAQLKRFKDDAREVSRGLRVRHPARGLQRPQGRRHPRGVRDAPGRAHRPRRGRTPAPHRSAPPTTRTCSRDLEAEHVGRVPGFSTGLDCDGLGPRMELDADVESPGTWHHGLVADWWAEFNTDGPEIDYFGRFVADGHALDAGCGAGRLLLPWLRAGYDVDGCDVSADMIARCRERADAEGLEPNVWVQALHELVPPRRYRTIVVCGVFGLGSTREQDTEALRRLHEALEPGARYFSTTRSRMRTADAGPTGRDKGERAFPSPGLRPASAPRLPTEASSGAPCPCHLLRSAKPDSRDGDPCRQIARRRERGERGAHPLHAHVLPRRVAADARGGRLLRHGRRGRPLVRTRDADSDFLVYVAERRSPVLETAAS